MEVNESITGEDPKLSVDDFATKIKAKYPQYKDVDNQELTQKIIGKYPQYATQVQFGDEKKSPSGNDGSNSIPQLNNGLGAYLSSPQVNYAPVTDPSLRKEIRNNDIASTNRQAQHQIISNAQKAGQVNQQAPVEDRGIVDKIGQGLYLPAFNQGFNDLVVKPLAGATDLIDRTLDKAYIGLTGEQTPDWLRKKGAFDKVAKYYDEQYESRDKPTNIVSDVAEGTVGMLPMMAALATGQGEVSLATKAPQFVNGFTKLLATTKAATAYKDATDQHKDYITSLNDAAGGAGKGALEGLTMEAQMLVGGALGKGVATKLAEKGLLKGGKAAEAVLHALSVGTVFGGTSAGEDLANGQDIDVGKAAKNFGMGLAFEMIPVAKAIGGEVKDAVDSKKINNGALQVASVSNAASNLHAESVIQTLDKTPVDQLLAINDGVKDGHEDLYANSIEAGAKAYEAKDADEKRQLYTNQLVLKTQGDVKFIADKVKKDPTEFLDEINNSEDLSPEQKQDLTTKINLLHDQQNQPEANPTNEGNIPETQPADETGVPADVSTQPIAQNEITDEQRKAQNDETDAKVKAFQKKFPDRKVDPLEDLPKSVVRTFDRVDSDLPTDPVTVNETSDWLYNKYKQLTAMKASDTRLLTTEQIDAMQEQLGQDITMLENHKLKYHGENEGVPRGETGGQGEAGTEIQPAEQAIASPNEVTEDIAGQEQATNEVTSNEPTTNTGTTEPVTGEVQQPEITAPKVETTKDSAAEGDKKVPEPEVKKEKVSKTSPAIKNENTKERAEKADIELDDHVSEQRDKKTVDKEATKEIKEGYDSHELVRKVLEDGHIPNDTENAILAKHTATIEKNYQDLTKRLESEGATMSKREFDDLSKEHEQAATDLDNAFNADVKAGTAQGRALQSRKFDAKNNFSLDQMIKNKRAANGGEKLTPEQVGEVNKRFQEIDEANKKLQARIDKLESDAAKDKATRTIKRIKDGEARLQKKAVTKEALAEDRKQIAADFSAKLKQMRSQGLNDVFKASAEFLQAAAPYVAKMVRNLALEGVTEIKDVVARVKEELDLKDLSDREVTDLIGGVYNEKKETKSDLESNIRDLKTQARLLGEIEDAEAGIAKAKKPLPKMSEKVKELRKRLDELQKSTPPTKEETGLKQSKTALQKRIAELQRRITEKDFSKSEPNQTKPDQELVDLRRKADRLKDEYGLQLAKDELANRTKTEKLKDDLLNIASLPRALKASLDFSAVLRQGLFLAPHLKESGTALKEMFGQTFSEEKYKNWIADLKHTPMYDLMQKSDLYLSDKNNHKLLAKEEEFTSNLADKIPIIGPAIEASERAYTSYLNVLRAGVFASEAQKLIERGYTFENNPKEFESLAKVVNVLSGRGDIPEFLGGKQPKILSAALFSPRFMAARIQTLYLWADPRLSKNARILAAKDIGKTLGSAAAILSMAALAGYTVVTDPRSTNFLKIQDKQEHGTTYYDIVGGLAQYVRFLAQQLSGQKIPINGKGIVTFGTKQARNTTRLTEAARFMRGKLSPLVGGAFNLMEGKDVVGQPYHLWPNVPQEFVPLPYTDVKEAYDVGGITNGLKALLPSQFGIGTSSYDPNKKTKK